MTEFAGRISRHRPERAGVCSATITIKGDSDADATTATLPGGSITADDTQKVFTNPSTEGRFWYNVAGSPTPDFYLVVTPLVSRRAT